ncbi:XdhC family protein [Methylopila sp. Yamaguchi]|uniref:XdhC family protein n=1 Tax=Methylopila sp. Yamaguchi TaxID=1437817 RepID=UPI000CAD06A1|nr:XdhC family protein [Methylopila sp. Yamaguchi]GBD47598.1 xanthine dehydrogenase accessory factor [Methylopila sp. Yamaguchi]
MRLELLAELNAARASRRAAVVVTELPGGAQRLVQNPAGDPLEAEIRAAIRSGRSGVVEADGARWFLTAHVPAPRMVVTGAVHISQALAPMAAAVGFEVTIVDPRTAFATPERFPGVDLRAEWPDVVLPDLALDPFTAFAALTHDPKIDDPALKAALDAGCFYVGALGSRKTHASRRVRLAAAGVSEDALDRVRAPIGLPIGAASPAEIAVSILAEVIAALRRPGERIP